jgi:hypothetical protein
MGLFEGTALAFLGMTWEFHAPVCLGDAIRVKWWVGSKHPTSKPDRGIVVREMEVLNQGRSDRHRPPPRPERDARHRRSEAAPTMRLWPTNGCSDAIRFYDATRAAVS